MDILNELREKQTLEITVWPENAGENEEIAFTSRVVQKISSCFLVEVPFRLEERLAGLMQKGVVVGALAYTSAQALIFYPVVNRFQSLPPRGYWLHVPPDCQHEVVKLRRHVRIEMRLPVTVEYHLNQTPTATVLAETIDTSGGGLKFSSSRLFHKGEEILLHLRFNPEAPLLQLPARVVMSCENEWSAQANGMAYHTACQFENLTEQQETLIMKECFRRELGIKPY